MSLHINTFPGPWRTLVTGASSRLRQTLAIVDALRAAEIARAPESERAALTECDPQCAGDAAPRYPISTVAGGDLNTSADNETAMLHLREHFPDSPPSHGQPTRAAFPTDHLLFRRRAGSDDRILEGSYRRLDSPYFSDHYPLIAWLAFGS